MSATLFAFALRSIDEALFVQLLHEAEGTYLGLRKRTNEPYGQIARDGYSGTINVVLSSALDDIVSEDTDRDLLAQLGGKPQTGIVIEPLGGSNNDELVLHYLDVLANHIDYIVTDFEDLNLTATQVRAKKRNEPLKDES